MSPSKTSTTEKDTKMKEKIEARLRKLEKINLQIMTENFEISNKIKVIEILHKSIFDFLDDLFKKIKELKAK
ncbi:hypothetical protein LCGC14_0953750 [marine sediment metagenome]|uniref:Uncharacterized protein n=1 Tax=marine sediment metagenome TaxID=412755 RepID=A0A0F9NGE0_9ZZZZ